MPVSLGRMPCTLKSTARGEEPMSQIPSAAADLQLGASKAQKELLEIAEAINKGQFSLGSFVDDAVFVIAAQAGATSRDNLTHWVDTLVRVSRSNEGTLMAYTHAYPTGISSCETLVTTRLGVLGRVELAYDPIRVILHTPEGASITRFSVRSDTKVEDYLTMNLDIDTSATAITLGLVELWRLEEIFYPRRAATERKDGLELLDRKSLDDYFGLSSDLFPEQVRSSRHLVIGIDEVLDVRSTGLLRYGDIYINTAVVCILLKQGYDLSDHHHTIRRNLEWIDERIGDHKAANQREVDELKAEMKELSHRLRNAKKKESIDPQLLAGLEKHLRPFV